jgi:hypothetical protein
MADSTVTLLTAASTLDGTEVYYGVQGGADRKVTGAQIKTLVLGSATISGANTGDQTITLTGDVTGSGSGSFTTAIGSTKVTSAKLNADVFSTAHSWGGTQTFTAPALGTPASGTLTNCAGLPVAGGGTGQATLTQHGVLVGNGTSGITALALAVAGTLLAGVASSDPAFTATPVLGIAGTTLGSIGLSGNTSGVITLKPQAAAGTYNFNLPITAGSSGDVLTSGGGGSTPMSWVTPIAINSLTDTWNNVATTFTAIKMNVTDTTSASASLLLDLQVATVSKFSVRKDGLATIAGAISVSGHTTFEGVTSTGATGTGALVYSGTPTLVTPVLGAATGTSIALGGATLGSNALAVTGHLLLEGVNTIKFQRPIS